MIKGRQIGGYHCHVMNWPDTDIFFWFDFDDVISDTGLCKKQVCKDLFGKDVAVGLLDSSKLEQAGLTKDQYRQIQYCVYKGGHKPLFSVRGAISGLNLLLEKKAPIGVLTARFDTNELELVRNFFECFEMTVPIVGVGYMASKEGAKAQILNSFSTQFYCDDDRKMIRSITNQGKPKFKLGLYDPASNADVPEGAELFQNWDEITKTIVAMFEA